MKEIETANKILRLYRQFEKQNPGKVSFEAFIFWLRWQIENPKPNKE